MRQRARDGSDQLAPSYEMSIGTEKEEPSFMPLLALGWTVVVPDYEGLKSAFTVGLHGVSAWTG
jgi:hypothetical protein